jgi:hypothetical protein
MSTFERLKLYYASHPRYLAAAFFAAGFVFDMLTLGRIDSWLVIGQQALYLAIILALLLQMFFGIETRFSRYRSPAVHFLLGALLNLYTLFFFKSSSLLVSFAFLAFLVVLLLANESERFKALGLHFKFALLSLCMLSFFAAVVPIPLRSIGLWVFLLSMLAGCLPLAAAAAWVRRRAPGLQARARREILVPLGSVLVGFLAFYLFRLIPPVPLSIPFIGVYHNVERTAEGYRLTHQRPAWRIWHNGDQWFAAQPGDRIYVYFRVFSPANFSDQVLLRWYKRGGSGADRWTLQDTIPIRIVGGREAGFRGYGVKTNYQPGEWKVQVETTDGREIGRVYFDLESVPEAQPREFAADLDA